MKRKKLTFDEREVQILDSAFTVFAEYGYQGAKTRFIADACGITEAVVYSHFKSKHDLYVGACKRKFRLSFERWSEQLQTDEPASVRLKKYLQTMIEDMLNDKNHCKMIVHGIGTSIYDREIREMVGSWLGLLNENIRSTIAAGIEDGSLRADVDPQCRTSIIRGLIWIHIVNVAMESPALNSPNYPYAFFDCILKDIGALEYDESFDSVKVQSACNQ